MGGDMEEVSGNPSTGGNSGEQVGRRSARLLPNHGGATCFCGKAFASRKAMYGHMRCHPEKERKIARGRKAVSAVETNSLERIDESSFCPASPLPVWCKRRRRGSKGTLTETDAVNGGARLLKNNALGSACEGAEADQEARWRKEAASFDSEEEPDSEVSTPIARSQGEESGFPQREGKGHVPGSQPCYCDCCRKRQFASSLKKEKEEGTETEPAGRRGYPCNEWSLTLLSSFQALGAHLENHGKRTERLPDIPGCGAVGSAAPARGKKASTKVRRRLEPTNEDHRCNQCSKVFPTGQALGGHKRLHWNGLKRRPPASGDVAGPSNPGELQKTSSSPRVRDFDLNELPQEEEGNEEMGRRIYL